MKCAKCHKEFGLYENCQYCGADKIVGLGSYIGYNPPKDSQLSSDSIENDNNSMYYTSMEHFDNNSICCFNCNEIIPADSQYCPICGQKLWITCPKCGKQYSSQYRICNQCGTNHQDYIEQQKREKEEREKEERLKQTRLEEERLKQLETEKQLKARNIELRREARKIRMDIENSTGQGIDIHTKILFALTIISTSLVLLYKFVGFVIFIILLVATIISFSVNNSKRDIIIDEKIKKWKKDNPDNEVGKYL